MRIRRFVLWLFFCVELIILGQMQAFAMNTAFFTIPVEDERADNYFKAIELSVFTQEPKKEAIHYFDVNEDGRVAVGYRGMGNGTVTIYTNSGEFLYGYTFKCTGDFAFEWDQDNIILYFVRSDIAVCIDNQGNLVETEEICNTTANNMYWYELRATHRRMGEITYIIQNDKGDNGFLPSYSKMVAVDQNGAERVVYDAGPFPSTVRVVALGLLLVFIGAVLTPIVKGILEYRRKQSCIDDVTPWYRQQ